MVQCVIVDANIVIVRVLRYSYLPVDSYFLSGFGRRCVDLLWCQKIRFNQQQTRIYHKL